MTEREKLIELLRKCDSNFELTCPLSSEIETDCISAMCEYNLGGGECDYISRRADYLLNNGVEVLPCKVGDTVYYPDYITGIAEKCQVYGFQLFANRKLQLLVDDGKLKFVTPNWYYTKEEAQKALERRKVK